MEKKKLHPVMLAGTGSDVGKSVLATALCRIFKQDGFTPAPFKAQNMALNSYATPDGLEIGRAQAVQAEAAGVACSADMNPLLLKPNSDLTTQVVLNGKPIGNRSAYEYFRKDGREELWKAVTEAFDRLDEKYNPVVMEGAGSIAEINLKDTDIVNMRMARHADADVLLVGDIDRGGVFASVYGSIMLQDEEDRKRIKGIIVNKFRGDMRLFDNGRKMMEDICGIPVLGVIPAFTDIIIEEEDSVELERKRRESADGIVNVAVILLRHLSNFTDFDTLERDERVNLFYTNNPEDIEKADIIIIPGTKATIDDLYELRKNGTAKAILKAHRNGASVLGICGGYQIMGLEVNDPDGIEGGLAHMPGLGLLPIRTTMHEGKTTRQVEFTFTDADGNNSPICRGYEIHQGKSIVEDGYNHLCTLSDGTFDGCTGNDRCIGTYIHGILDNEAFIDHLLNTIRDKCQIKEKTSVMTAEEFKEHQYDLLADHVRRHLDMDKLYEIITR